MDKVNLASRAQELLDNVAFEMAFNAVTNNIESEIMDADLTDAFLLQSLVTKKQVLASVRSEIQFFIDDLKVERHTSKTF